MYQSLINSYEKQEMVPGSYREGESQRLIACVLQLSGKPVRKYAQVYEALIVRSESPVIAQSSTSIREAFIRQSYVPVKVCEFDRSEMKLYFSGTLVRLQVTVFTGVGSNYRYALVFNRPNTTAFMKPHVRFFEMVIELWRSLSLSNPVEIRWLMHVIRRYTAISVLHSPNRLVFMKKNPRKPCFTCAVIMVIERSRNMVLRIVFCNAYRGNEKGYIEWSVKYVCLKAFERRGEIFGDHVLAAAIADRLTHNAGLDKQARRILPYQRNRKNNELTKRCAIVVKLPKSMLITCLRIYSETIYFKGFYEYLRHISCDICGKETNRSRMKYVTAQIRAPDLSRITKRMGF